MDVADKIDHRLPEIRRRAIRTLKFKLKTGIVSTETLAVDVDVLRKLVSSVQRSDVAAEELPDVLELLSELANHPAARANLATTGLSDVLCTMDKKVLREAAPLAQLLKERLLHADINVISPKSKETRGRPDFTPINSSCRTGPNRPRRSGSPQKSPVRFARPLSAQTIRSGASPVRSAYEAYPSTLPYLPNVLRTYDLLDLGPGDEDLFNEFCVNMNAESQYQTFQSMICDFGAGIFLQKSQMFWVILQNAKADPSSQSFACLATLLKEWQREFRKSVDSLPTVRPVPNGADLSQSSHGNSAFAEHGSMLSDCPISIPFACHEIFVELIPLLRKTEAVPSVLRMLYLTLPFIKMHVSIGLALSPRANEEATVIHYVASILEIVKYLGKDTRAHQQRVDADQIHTPKRLVTFAINVFADLSSLIENPQHLWQKILDLFSCLTTCTGTVAEQLLSQPTSPARDRTRISYAMDTLLASQSHAQFHDALEALQTACVCPADAEAIDESALTNILTRILTVPPANDDDMTLLCRMLFFVEEAMEWNKVSMDVDHLLLPAFQRLVLPILRRGPQDRTRQEDTATINIEEHILPFAVHLFWRLTTDAISRIETQTDCVSVLTGWIRRACHPDRNAKPWNICHALEVLADCLALPGISGRLDVDVLKHTVGLLVSIIAEHQMRRAQEESHYINRGIYLRSAICLRLVCRIGTGAKGADEDWIWGNHWLHDESFQWLVGLLDDQDSVMQKLGMGILANLVIVDRARQALEAEIPFYVEVALQTFMDVNGDHGIRKEALLLIKNVIVCAATSDQQIDDTGTQEGGKNHALQHAVSMLIGGGFFQTLPSALALDTSSVWLREGLAELLLCLVMVAPQYVSQSFSELDLWNAIVLSLDHSWDRPVTEEMPEIYQRFQKRQHRDTHWSIVRSFGANMLQVLWILMCDNQELQLLLLEKTFILDRVGNTLRDCWSVVSSDAVPSDLRAVVEEVLESAFRVLCELLLPCATHRQRELEALFHEPETAFDTARVIAWSLCRDSDSRLPRVAAQALSRLLAIHCGMMADLNLYTVLAAKCGGAGDKRDAHLGVVICDALANVLFKSYEVEDPVYMEAVRLSLQSLLGCCEFVKLHALQSGMMTSMIRRLQCIAEQAQPLDDAQLHEVFTVSALLRHALAGSSQMKIAAGKQRLHLPFQHILVRKECGDILLLEVLHCVRNLIANCTVTKKLLLENIPTKRVPHNVTSSIVTTIISLVRQKATSLPVFNAAFEVMKLVALGQEARSVMWKSNIGATICTILSNLAKSKEHVKMQSVLEFFCNSTYAADGQLHMMRIDGAFDLFLNLAATGRTVSIKRTAVQILRNLAVAKENQPHFLLSATFVPTIRSLIGNKSLDILAPTTGLLRVLLYDSEKSKVALKREMLGEDLTQFRQRLQSEYAAVLHRNGSAEAALDAPIPEQDLVLLHETMKHLDIVNGALADG
ncbi:hypothetical protein DFJ77DRAFT_461726 [Powellomyces hirtus]|nr:hypothetical protein DFJ77DRAFT_461726 [Powellomyces hirtus]